MSIADDPVAILLDRVDLAISEFGQVRQAQSDRPNDRSDAARELDEQEPYAGAWGADPVVQAYSQAQLLLLAGEDHLRALDRLLRREPLAFAPVAVSRAAIEVFARAGWLLDSNLDSKNRIARGMTERLHSLRERAKLPADYNEPNPPHERIARIIEGANERGFSLVCDSRGEPVAVEEKRPSSTDAVDALLSKGGDGLGGVLYRITSAMAHGTMFGLLMRFEMEPAENQPITAALPAMRPGNSTLIASAALLAYVRAVDALVARMGWPSPWPNPFRHPFVTMRQTLLDAKPTPAEVEQAAQDLRSSTELA